ncbi:MULTISPECIES: hypothetical protein [Pseudomonas]|uniref:Uncharacterized protein n=1 Tax=Pseudomonas sessilinigenes TaxID=658629 RepID=A0ABX8MLE0_9PSED|nr:MULTISPECIES: hypothetical protein [Pseudomonas]AZC27034.1 hypothetical protein C4K39_5390 [Pseudomonas sessilinigenes]QXH39011.1 hypothetical protein KSS89_22600 [Pseudomonas sessilinigenes]UMZ09443.1 hypothetical protein I9018_18045 [Pseudomonas sp. MPFS]
MAIQRQRPYEHESSDETEPCEVEHKEPPPQTWKHPDDGKSLSELDEERPLKP